MLEFRVLGPVEALEGSTPLDLGGPQQRAVLALLLLRANEVVPRERLVDELWGDAPPATARETLKVYVGRLRKVLLQNGGSARLATRGSGYLLGVDPGQIDLVQFQRLSERGAASRRAGDEECAAALLRDALELWHGPPLADLGDAAFVRAEQARLDELRLAALEERFAADLALGRASAVVAELRQLVRERPHDERFHRQLMTALYRSGRQADALGVYRDLRGHLASEFGLEPSSETQALERSILTADPALSLPTGAQPEHGVAVAGRRPHSRTARSGARRRLIPVAAAFSLIAAAAVGIVVTGTFQPADGAGRVVGRIPVPLRGGPWVGKLAFGAGSLWIRKSGDDELLRVDPGTNTITARIRIGFAYDTGIAIRRDDVWVTNGEDGTVSRIDAVTNRVVATISVGAYPLGIAATKGAVWVANHHNGSVSRIEPRLNRVVATVPISTQIDLAGPKAIAADGDRVWVADAYSGAVVRVDPQRNRRVESIGESGPACGGMALFRGSVWVASACGRGTVTRIDARTAIPTAHIHVPGVALDVASGLGSIWVATTNGLLLRVDPKTNRIVGRLHLPDGVWMTTGGGSVWAIDRTTRSVVRLQPAG